MSKSEPTTSALAEAIAALPLVDHHVHSFANAALTDDEVLDHLTESPDRHGARTSPFDASLGLAVRKVAGPLLGLVPPVDAAAYLHQRSLRAPLAWTRTCLEEARLGALLVDTGFHQDRLLDLGTLAELGVGQVREIRRIEHTAETMLAALDSPEAFLVAWTEAIGALPAEVVGWKSVAAYRSGLALPAEVPSRAEVLFALGHELRRPTLRLADPVVIRYLLATVLEATDLPIQFHVGLGDPDVRLATGRPGHLQPFIEEAVRFGNPICLLHCYPYHREAALLAHDYPHVFLDLGPALGFVGPYAQRILSETLELAPFAKLLYASDAYLLPELAYLGAVAFREALLAELGDLVESTYLNEAEAIRIARLIGHVTANELYRLP
jgi:hypothetical protein